VFYSIQEDIMRSFLTFLISIVFLFCTACTIDDSSYFPDEENKLADTSGQEKDNSVLPDENSEIPDENSAIPDNNSAIPDNNSEAPDNNSETPDDVVDQPDEDEKPMGPGCGNGINENGEFCDTEIDCSQLGDGNTYEYGKMAPCSDDCQSADASDCVEIPDNSYGSIDLKFYYDYIYFREDNPRYGSGTFCGGCKDYDKTYATHEDYMAAFPGTTIDTPANAFFTATFGEAGKVPTDDADKFKAFALFVTLDAPKYTNGLGDFREHTNAWQLNVDADGNVMREKAVLFQISTMARLDPSTNPEFDYHNFGVNEDRAFNGMKLFIVDLDDTDVVHPDSIKCVHAVVKPGSYMLLDYEDAQDEGYIKVDDPAGYTFKLMHPSNVSGFPSQLPQCDLQ